MIRWMKIILAIAIALICGPTAVSPVFAQSDTASTKYFSAKIANIRRAATGKTLVTVLFKSFAPDTGSVTLYGWTTKCRDSATLIDGNGEEYGTIRCMALSSGNSYGDVNGTGLYIEGSTSASFVYEFSTPISTDENARININILMPIFYRVCLINEYDRNICTNSTTSLSFYGLTAR